MARPAVKEVKLKSGFYIEVSTPGSLKGTKIRRDSFEQIQLTMRNYEHSHAVKYIGQVKNGKLIDK